VHDGQKPRVLHENATSRSSAQRFVKALGPENLERLPPSVRFACMEPGASTVARGHGLEVSIEAEEPTIRGLVRAILEAC